MQETRTVNSRPYNIACNVQSTGQIVRHSAPVRELSDYARGKATRETLGRKRFELTNVFLINEPGYIDQTHTCASRNPICKRLKI